jgi:putative lipoic acid-binding regulatory protein
MTDDNNEQETVMAFPCEFAIKAMGFSNKKFDLTVVEIVRRHSPDIPEGAVKTKPSKTGKYVSVTVTITAQSKKQMDAIYQDLTDSEHVLMSL